MLVRYRVLGFEAGGSPKGYAKRYVCFSIPFGRGRRQVLSVPHESEKRYKIRTAIFDFLVVATIDISS